MSLFQRSGFAALALVLVAAPLSAKGPAAPSASAPIFNSHGSDAGYGVITTRRDKAVLKISIGGLSPGEHGMHFHTVGSCKGDLFAGAGSHLNPGMKMHGMKNPAGSHLGDLPNVTANEGGMAFAEIPLAGSAKRLFAALFDSDGTAIVVHASADDYTTDPSGNSGTRVACGVFRKN